MNMIGKKRGRKHKIQHVILQSIGFQLYKTQYFLSGIKLEELNLFLINTFMCFPEIKNVFRAYIFTLLSIHQGYIYCGILRWDSFSVKRVSSVFRSVQIGKNVVRFPQ